MKKIWIGVVLVAAAAAGAALLVHFRALPARMYPGEQFGIAAYVSPVDRDGDGTDDQTDLLQGVRAYLATKPKYKSRYYGSGYPDDGCGVCTDVVAFGMKAAGYDLMELVAADAAAYPKDYEAIVEPDPAIDFRRVRNLLVWLQHNAAPLTRDLKEIEEWQGGDIVVFPGHIGVVSDMRNRDGVPFLLHHSSTFQLRYEEDALADYEIVGHFRVDGLLRTDPAG